MMRMKPRTPRKRSFHITHALNFSQIEWEIMQKLAHVKSLIESTKSNFQSFDGHLHNTLLCSIAADEA